MAADRDPKTVMSVTGPVRAEDLGMVLPHEHLFANTLAEYRSGGLLNDEALMAEEASRFAMAGGSTIVDLTTDEIGRRPEALRRLSRSTGITVVMGSGHYREPYLDRDWFDRNGVDEIAALLIKEIRNGVGQSGVRPGVIGEIGCNAEYISSAEERSFRAAARAHLETGLTISTHAARWPVGREQARILGQEGVDPRRVIIGHCDTVPDRDYHVELAEQGYFVQFDGFSSRDDYDLERSIGSILSLMERGHAGQILISHDVFLSSHLHGYGGGGYDFIPTRLMPELSHRGLSEADLEMLTVHNPRRALVG